MQKIAGKLLEIMKGCSHIGKNGTNPFHGYKYVTSADVLERVNAALVENHVASVVVPELVSLLDVVTAKGNREHLATVKVHIALIDKDSGESCEIVGLGSGQDSGDKAVMKAQTAAIKYAYMLSLSVSAGDDPEADQRTDENMAIEAVSMERKSNAKASSGKRPAGAGKGGALVTCSDCGVAITEKVKQFSERRYGKALCMDCQRREQGIA